MKLLEHTSIYVQDEFDMIQYHGYKIVKCKYFYFQVSKYHNIYYLMIFQLESSLFLENKNLG